MQFMELRQKHPIFSYKKYEVLEENGTIKLKFFFEQEDMVFSPEWILPFSFDLYQNGDKAYIDYLVFNLGMVELVSYWKSACSPQVQVECGTLQPEQIAWWKKLYFHGLGEFFYVNQIETTQEEFMELTCTAIDSDIPNSAATFTTNGTLIPIGGGKDSAVTLELLKESKAENRCYIINPRGATLETAEVAGYAGTDTICFQRTIDKGLLERNKAGYWNGHTPFSAIIAFSSLLAAYFSGRKSIALSNESSANESYVRGKEVNHQYSKSIEFENDFRWYVKNYLSDTVDYFSMLRPWNEWRIVREFVKHKQYYAVFKSCNQGSKENIWCGKCSKCLFVYGMFRPFLNDGELIQIFGKDLLEEDTMFQFLDGLVAEEKDKPFECVGTKVEINTALSYAIEKIEAQGKKLPKLLEYYKQNYYAPANVEAMDTFFDETNNLPPEFLKIIRGRML